MDSTRTHIFMSGIPNKHTINEDVVTDSSVIIKHVLNQISPEVSDEEYKIVYSFRPKEGHTRHSAKIVCNDTDIKESIMKNKLKLRALGEADPLRKVFLRNENSSMYRKGNDRLYSKLCKLKEDDPENDGMYKIDNRKLLRGDEVLDEFNLVNSIFH